MHGVPAYYENQVVIDSDVTIHLCLDYFNKRLRVDDYRGNVKAISARICEIAEEHGFTKAFVKSREEHWLSFLSEGYMPEGVYKAYYDGRDAYCMAVYFDLARRTSDYWLEEDEILRQVFQLSRKPERSPLPDGCVLRPACVGDAEALASLYEHIFPTYPTPMNDPSYVAKVIEEGTVFYLIERSNSLMSAASAELNTLYRNAEITDCATLPACRGLGLMRILIQALEEELQQRGIRCAYSLSRALSFGMNASLYQADYRYYGRLTKNCEIYEKLEDMNLWVKMLPLLQSLSSDGG